MHSWSVLPPVGFWPVDPEMGPKAGGTGALESGLELTSRFQTTPPGSLGPQGVTAAASLEPA